MGSHHLPVEYSQVLQLQEARRDKTLPSSRTVRPPDSQSIALLLAASTCHIQALDSQSRSIPPHPSSLRTSLQQSLDDVCWAARQASHILTLSKNDRLSLALGKVSGPFGIQLNPLTMAPLTYPISPINLVGRGMRVDGSESNRAGIFQTRGVEHNHWCGPLRAVVDQKYSTCKRGRGWSQSKPLRGTQPIWNIDLYLTRDG